MRLLDQDPIDPEIAATLDAIDATLAGEPVDGQYADMAEIALLLNADRPQAPEEFGRSLDERVERRFARPSSTTPRRRRVPYLWQSMGALAAGVALVVAIVVVAGGGGSGASNASSTPAELSSLPSKAHAAASSAAAGPARAAKSASASANSSAALTPSTSAAPTLTPPTTGRKVVQSAQLNLTAAPSRIDAVAQEVYDVVGQVNGIVNGSSVTQGGPGGYATFQLSVPSASLGQTMTKLSELTYAQVASRTDGTQDITGQFDAATRALADARALRTSLLKRLANATSTEQVNSLTAQIHDADASISSDQATLARLNNQVNFSRLDVQINAGTPPVPVSHRSGGFGIGRAAHDAGRVLTVAAAVALIGIAALTPVALVVALAWWVGTAIRRRRREQALDSV